MIRFERLLKNLSLLDSSIHPKYDLRLKNMLVQVHTCLFRLLSNRTELEMRRNVDSSKGIERMYPTRACLKITQRVLEAHKFIPTADFLKAMKRTDKGKEGPLCFSLLRVNPATLSHLDFLTAHYCASTAQALRKHSATGDPTSFLHRQGRL